jgi:hypothetical protein
LITPHHYLRCCLQEAEERGNDLMATLMAASHAAGDSQGGVGGDHEGAGLVATLNQQFSLDVEVVAAMARVGHVAKQWQLQGSGKQENLVDYPSACNHAAPAPERHAL